MSQGCLSCFPFAGTTIDLLSGSAGRMLWNQVFFGIFMALLIFSTIFIKQPLGMHFAVDIAYLQGEPRNETQALYRKPEFYKHFVWLTALFAFRSLFQAGLKSYLLMEYGVKKYDFILFAMKISGWIFGALITAGFVFISVKIYNYHEKKKDRRNRAATFRPNPRFKFWKMPSPLPACRTARHPQSDRTAIRPAGALLPA